jgi:hypothetical protein
MAAPTSTCSGSASSTPFESASTLPVAQAQTVVTKYADEPFPEEDLKLATPEEEQMRTISRAPRRKRKVISRPY